jgi:hypothetical protein
MDQFHFSCAISPNRTNTIVLSIAATFYIRLVVRDDEDQPARVPYQIKGQRGENLFEGQTDSQGFINHDDVPLDDFVLVIGAYQTKIPTVRYEDERCVVFLPQLGFTRLAVLDASDKPLAGTRYEISRKGTTVFNACTNPDGSIKHDYVPLDDYDLAILEHRVKVPAVAYEDEMVSVFLRGGN